MAIADAVNPFTGEVGAYDSPSTSAGVGMTAMGAAGVDAPLAYRLLENMPGMPTMFFFSANRGANTLIRGGYKEKLASTTSSRGDYFGGGRISRGRGMLGRRAERLASGQSSRAPVLRPGARNNAPRPRNFMRFSDRSIFYDPKYNRYSPFGASSTIGNSKYGKVLAGKILGSGEPLAAGESAFGPGLLSFVTAGQRADRLERRAAGGSSRAARKLAKVDETILDLLKVNNPGALTFNKGGSVFVGDTASGVLGHSARPSGSRKASNRNLSKNQKRKLGFSKPDSSLAGQRMSLVSPYSSAMETAVSGRARVTAADDVARGIFRDAMPGYAPAATNVVGVRGNLLASGMAGGASKYLAGYTRGALGYGGAGGLHGRALDGSLKAQSHFVTAVEGAFGTDGMTLKGGRKVAAEGAVDFLQETGGKKFFRQLGLENIGKIATTQGGGKFLAARAGALAIPGLNAVAVASMAYDIGKMAGEVVKSGINLARDGAKSIEGSIAKPLMGMGYKDTEAAATSRARGVMAIQNSRLNMRSLLGNEASMMAARYG